MSRQKEKIFHYETEEQKKQHFKETVNKNISIIDRQFKKLAKIPRARTYIYDEMQVNKIIEHLSKEVVELENLLKKKTTVETSFQV